MILSGFWVHTLTWVICSHLPDYVRIGPRFSNAVLQILLVLLKREPPKVFTISDVLLTPQKGRRLFILATSSNKQLIQDMEFLDSFNAILQVPQISNKEEFKNALQELDVFEEADLEKAASAFQRPIPIKKLIMICEMAKQGNPSKMLERFHQYIQDHSLSVV